MVNILDAQKRRLLAAMARKGEPRVPLSTRASLLLEFNDVVRTVSFYK